MKIRERSTMSIRPLKRANSATPKNIMWIDESATKYVVNALIERAIIESISELNCDLPDELTRLIFVLLITRMRIAGTIIALKISVSVMMNESSTQSSEWSRSRAIPSRIHH